MSDIADGMMKHPDWTTPDRVALIDRTREQEATVEDLLQYARCELWDAIGCSEGQPGQAIGDGRKIDSFHAGCCMSRAEAAIWRALKKMGALPDYPPPARDLKP